jgi:hypothetical protein
VHPEAVKSSPSHTITYIDSLDETIVQEECTCYTEANCECTEPCECQPLTCECKCPHQVAYEAAVAADKLSKTHSETYTDFLTVNTGELSYDLYASVQYLHTLIIELQDKNADLQAQLDLLMDGM